MDEGAEKERITKMVMNGDRQSQACISFFVYTFTWMREDCCAARVDRGFYYCFSGLLACKI